MMWLHDLDVRAVEFFAKEESVKLRYSNNHDNCAKVGIQSN